MNMLYNAWIKIDNRRKRRRRKQVKRCSSANLSLERTSALTLSISFIGLLLLKVNGIMGACKRRWCIYVYKDEMLTGLSCLFNYFSFFWLLCLLSLRVRPIGVVYRCSNLFFFFYSIILYVYINIYIYIWERVCVYMFAALFWFNQVSQLAS
jgi:hypothetical protein